MNNELSRRKFLAACGRAGTVGLFAAGPWSLMGMNAFAQSDDAKTITLEVVKRSLEVKGKSASVFGLVQPDGTPGIYSNVNQHFRVAVHNKTNEKTAIHWHGLHPPNNQDGVPGITQPFIQPDSSVLYNFPLKPAGTHWMHSHAGFQEAQLMAAPLIVHEDDDKKTDEQEIVVLIHDFSFKHPEEIYAGLLKRGGGQTSTMSMSMSAQSKKYSEPKSLSANMTGMNGMKMTMSAMSGMANSKDMKMDMSSKGVPANTGARVTSMAAGKMSMDANDVDYDAYLINDRDLSDPQVVSVEKSGRVRLRVINASSGTNYTIDLGELEGEAIAVDGIPVVPIRGRHFPLAVAQRIDIRVQIPASGAFPILALREGALERTGIVLSTPAAPIKKLDERSQAIHVLLNSDFEKQLQAVNPLSAKPVGSTHLVRLTGDMSKYVWSINDQVFALSNQPQIKVKLGDRVALNFVNETSMSHPMHLHGHSFQVTEIDGNPIAGAIRDSLLVPPKQTIKVVFDADNPGLWFVHCHIAWHLKAGMATTVQYEA